MRWLLFLFLPFLLQGETAFAPGMYPPEEMESDVPTVPRNPYQIMDDNAPPAYQFYYEKDDSDNSGIATLSSALSPTPSPSEPAPPTIPLPPPLPLSVSPPSGSRITLSASSSAPSPPAAYLVSSSETPSSDEDTSYISLIPSNEEQLTEIKTPSLASSVPAGPSSTSPVFTTSSPRTTAATARGFQGEPKNAVPTNSHGSSVVFASEEEGADPRSKVEQLIQEEHKVHEVPMSFNTASEDQEYGESGTNNKEPNKGNPLDYRPVPKTPSPPRTNENKWESSTFEQSGNSGKKSNIIHSGEQPPVFDSDFNPGRGDAESGESIVPYDSTNSYKKITNDENQLERNSGNNGRHTGQYTNQVTLGPDSTRSWIYGGAPEKLTKKKACCACCGDDAGPREPSNSFSDPDSDFGEPKPVITDKQGYQESIQTGNMVERPYSPEIPTLAPQQPLPVNTQPSNGYQPSNPIQTPSFPGQQPFPQQTAPASYQPVGSYQPLYDTSSSGCACAAPPPPPMCCQPITPCCLPTIPCCPPPPPIPCCPQPAVCCQPPPAPCCPVPQTCCSQPVIPLCFRSCPSCPCRRRLHAHLRMKRSPGPGCQSQCTANGQVLPGRMKRQTPGCKSCNSSPNPLTSLFGQLNTGCGTCTGSHRRVKRLGCLPCLGRKKRDIDEEHHRRVKRLGCLPCLGKRKKRSLGNCHSCSNLGNILHRAKRTICSPCAGRKKRDTENENVRRAPCPCQANRDSTSYRSSYTLSRNKRETDETYDSVFTCDKSCCDYDKCDKIRAKRLDLN